jgi:hypothetical protein
MLAMAKLPAMPNLPIAASAALPVAEGVTAHPMHARPPNSIPAAMVLCLRNTHSSASSILYCMILM